VTHKPKFREEYIPTAVVHVLYCGKLLQYCKLTAVPRNEMLQWTDSGEVKVILYI